MVKHNNLDYSQRNALEAEYNRRVPAPSEPKYAQPPVPRSQVIKASRESRIYVETDADSTSFNEHSRECKGRLTLVAGQVNFTVDLVLEDMDALIRDLEIMRNSVRETNAARTDHYQKLQQWRGDMERWKKQRDKTLAKRLDRGDITGAMIDDDEQLQKIQW